MKLKFILFQAYLFVCNATSETLWYRDLEISAGDKWVKNAINIPEGYTGVIHAMVDTSKYVCAICGNELVQTSIYELKTKLYTSKEISDENTIYSRNENLGKFSNLDAGNYDLDIYCRNSSRDCDVDIKIKISRIRNPTEAPTPTDEKIYNILGVAGSVIGVIGGTYAVIKLIPKFRKYLKRESISEAKVVPGVV